MSVEENKVLVCRAVEAVWNRGNLAYVDEAYSSDTFIMTRICLQYVLVRTSSAELPQATTRFLISI